MNRTVVNIMLVIAAGAIYISLGLYSGRTAINNGLGADGQVYAAMVTSHQVQGGTVNNRVWPAFPLTAAVVYAATGQIVTSFAVINIIGLLILALAACMILDAHAAPTPIKACAILTLGIIGLPTVITAYGPAQPYLFGLALVTLGIAACEVGGALLIVVATVAATLGAPVGLIAPLYGIARSWRMPQRRVATMLMFAPALLAWLAVQVWARGGPAGFLELFQLSRQHADAVLWTEFSFILFGVYFLLTTMGGLTMLMCSRPAYVGDTLRERPELWALVAPVLLFIVTAGLETPTMIPFLIPFWLITIGMWARTQSAGSVVVASIGAAVLTLLTQHPWTRVTDVSYFVDWFPYSVHAARVKTLTMTDAMLADVWRVRVWIVIGGLIVLVGWQRVSASRVRR